MPGILEACVFSVLCAWGTAENHEADVNLGLQAGPVYVQYNRYKWGDWTQDRTGVYWWVNDRLTLYAETDNWVQTVGFNWRF